MSQDARTPMHGRNHKGRNADGRGGGSDPAVLNVDSTENVGSDQGVHSHGSELNWALLSTGPPNYGSRWGPTSGVSSPFFDVVADLNATRDLRGYWRLGEGATPFADTSGHANGPADANVAGTGSGNAMDQDITGALPTDDDDGGVEFLETDGVGGEYLTTSDPGVDRFHFDAAASTYTITAFVKPNASGSSFTGCAVGNWNDIGGIGGWKMGVIWPARTTYCIRRNTGGTQPFITGPTLTAGTWYFMAATNSSAGQKLYINGTLVGANPTTVTVPASTSGPTFGRNGLGSPTESFYGAIDEVTIWGDELTADEIAQLAVAGDIVASEFLQYVSVTGAYTATSNDDVILASGTFTVTLPSAVGIGGKEFKVKNNGGGTITLAQAGTEQIDGSATDLTLAANDAVNIVSDGSNWFIVASYSYP